jgi:uncharacterized protein (TIGR03067 family)
MRALLAVLVATGLAVAALAGADDDAVKKEKQSLQGKWTIVSVDRDGKAVDMWKDGVRLIEGDNYTLTTKGGDSFKGTFALDPAKVPKAIDFSPAGGQYKGKTLRGIYEIDGDMLKICFAEPDKERPTEFSSKAGSGWTLATHKKQK